MTEKQRAFEHTERPRFPSDGDQAQRATPARRSTTERYRHHTYTATGQHLRRCTNATNMRTDL